MADDKGDRRSDPRLKTVRAAVTLFDSPFSPMPCVVLDLSERGARINAPFSAQLPDSFQLTIESQNLKRACEVVWRRGDEIGVRFVVP